MMITDSFLQVFDKIANSVTDNCCNVYEKQADVFFLFLNFMLCCHCVKGMT